jgi:hypothetical protein
MLDDQELFICGIIKADEIHEYFTFNCTTTFDRMQIVNAIFARTDITGIEQMKLFNSMKLNTQEYEFLYATRNDLNAIRSHFILQSGWTAFEDDVIAVGIANSNELAIDAYDTCYPLMIYN